MSNDNQVNQVNEKKEALHGQGGSKFQCQDCGTIFWRNYEGAPIKKMMGTQFDCPTCNGNNTDPVSEGHVITSSVGRVAKKQALEDIQKIRKEVLQ